MIWYDRAQRSIVVGCHECGTREIHASQAAADKWVLDHVARVHTNARAGYWATEVVRRRHARDPE